MFVRGSHVGVRKVKNGVLHIVAPRRGYPVKLLKQPENCQPLRKDLGSRRRSVLDNPQGNQEE